MEYKKILIVLLFITTISIACKPEPQAKYGQKYVYEDGTIYSDADNTNFSEFEGKTVERIYFTRNSFKGSHYAVIIKFTDGSEMGVNNYKYKPTISY